MAENKIEEYLIDLKYNYQELKPNFWLIDDTDHDLEGIVVTYVDPLVVFRVQVMSIPGHNQEEFYKKLLELNTSDMIKCAYGLEGDKVVITGSLEYETLDYNEFRATVDAIGLALTQHYPILSVYRENLNANRLYAENK
jgi:hypothetical protein